MQASNRIIYLKEIEKAALEKKYLYRDEQYFHLDLVQGEVMVTLDNGGLRVPAGKISNIEEFSIVDEIPSNFETGYFFLGNIVAQGVYKPRELREGFAQPFFTSAMVKQIGDLLDEHGDLDIGFKLFRIDSSHAFLRTINDENPRHLYDISVNRQGSSVVVSGALACLDWITTDLEGAEGSILLLDQSLKDFAG